MANDAHATESHNNAGPLGGLCDGTAVGLGSGLVIGGICVVGGWMTPQAWVGLTVMTVAAGVGLGAWWGQNRGY